MTRTSLARALLALLVVPNAMTSEAQDPYARERRLMLEDIAAITRETRTETGRGALAPAVMKAMETVPRERFVPADLARSAYENRPLPIGRGQTISQQFIVALMTDFLDRQADRSRARGGHRVGLSGGDSLGPRANNSRESSQLERPNSG